MNTNEWITDRLPTLQDADRYGYVWVTDIDGTVQHMWWHIVTDQPWMRSMRPKPYVKPKRYEVCSNWTGQYYVQEIKTGINIAVFIPTREAAERIAAIYEEVMP